MVEVSRAQAQVRHALTLASAAMSLRTKCASCAIDFLALQAPQLFDGVGVVERRGIVEHHGGDAVLCGPAIDLALGESSFAEAEVQGRAMTMEQAVAYALEDQE